MSTHTVITAYLRGQIQPGVDAVGGFFRTCVLTGKALFRRPFHWRETIEQGWFITSVSLLPTLAVSIPLTVLIIFTLNILLAEFGAADISGAGAALGAFCWVGSVMMARSSLIRRCFGEFSGLRPRHGPSRDTARIARG